MPNIPDGKQLEANILKDMRVELADEFDKNFQRKAFLPTHGSRAKTRKLLALSLWSRVRCGEVSKARSSAMACAFLLRCPTQRSITRAAKARSLSGRITAQARKENAIRFAPINAVLTCRSVSS